MKEYKFEITLKEKDLIGDEFWENIIKEDHTGIKPLYRILVDIIKESNIIVDENVDISDLIKLKEFKNE